MQRGLVALSILALIACASAGPIVSSGLKKVQPTHSLEFSFCGLCNQFMAQGINQLLNAALQVGVVGGCQDLCSVAFPTKATEQKICDLLCDGVGIYSFIKLLDKFGKDIDTIYFCELLHACTVQDGGAAKMDSFVVNPPSGPKGTQFEITAAFSVLNATGAGELAIDVIPPADMPFGDGQIYDKMAPGQYGVKFDLQAEPSEDESFEAGVYKVQFALCEGQCGATYPHSAILTTGMANFTITA
jgi:hypothetical protein